MSLYAYWTECAWSLKPSLLTLWESSPCSWAVVEKGLDAAWRPELSFHVCVFTKLHFHKMDLSLVCKPIGVIASWSGRWALGVAVRTGVDAKCCPFLLHLTPLLKSHLICLEGSCLRWAGSRSSLAVAGTGTTKSWSAILQSPFKSESAHVFYWGHQCNICSIMGLSKVRSAPD